MKNIYRYRVYNKLYPSFRSFRIVLIRILADLLPPVPPELLQPDLDVGGLNLRDSA